MSAHWTGTIEIRPTLADPLRPLVWLRAWMTRAASRRALAELDDHLLRDCGIGRGEAAREAAKPFWMA